MGFNSVYRVLQEIFPQVDSRILRAVAIEHSKDADVAVEVVLGEIMPSLSRHPESGWVSHPSSGEGWSLSNPFEAVETSDTADQTYEALLNANGRNDGLYEDNGSNELASSSKGAVSTEVEPDMSFMISTILTHENGVNEEHDEVYRDSVSDNIFLSRRYQESSTEEGMDVLNGLSDQTRFCDHLLEDSNDFVDCSSDHEEEKLSIDGNPLEINYSVPQVAPSPVQNSLLNAPESSIQLVAVPVMPNTDVKELVPSGPVIAVSGNDISSSEMVDCENQSIANTMVVYDTSIMDLEKKESSDSCIAASEKGSITNEMDDLEDETAMKAMILTRSGQICSTELLEDMLENARSEKISLRSAEDSLVSLMNEVEQKEKSVEQAREEATHGVLDTFARVEDLKQMLQRAKEANDMHAGEVYGEKAILATEVRELQSRLLSLADERVKALAILDEMRQALELRLTVAEEEIKKAEQEKLEKEESAQKYLAHGESIMEKLVQESKILEQEAEENSKLREFLMDRGRSVDMLQGEISVICQDVKLMKENFDQRVPLMSKSLSSSQTDSVLAYSSSLLSTESDKVPELAGSPENPKASAIFSIGDKFFNEVPRTLQELKDDGWEFFD